jgi:hypothetical protein
MSSSNADTLRSTLANVVVGTIAGSLGITSFIKEELVADGNRAPAVRFPHPARVTRPRVKAALGMSLGRALDRAFSDSVDRGVRVIPGSSNSRVHAALRAAGIVPVKTQHRVLTSQSMLTTCLDCVGVTANNEVVCIELKSCQLPSADYEAYANAVCRRTPRFRCTTNVANTERNRHFVQTGYGTMALAAQLGRPCIGVLIVATYDKALLYMCPTEFQLPTLFRRLPASAHHRAPTAPKRISTARVGTLLESMDWTVARVATRVGFTPQKRAISKGIYELKRANGDTVGVMANAPTWASLCKSNRLLVSHALARAALKLTSPLPRIATYVVGPATPGGAATLLVIGSPITARRV